MAVTNDMIRARNVKNLYGDWSWTRWHIMYEKL